jgi:predicted RNA-binding Zn-ribbon protein involved in translation (DUF1610 family)
MTDGPITSFVCPDCGSVYKVVRLLTPPQPHDYPVACLGCGLLLEPRDGEFLLKYFRMARPAKAGLRGAGMRGSSPQRDEDIQAVALCPDCGFVGAISSAPGDDRGELIYRCEECQLAFERRAKS